MLVFDLSAPEHVIECRKKRSINLDDPRCAAPGDPMISSATSNKISWIKSVIRLADGSTYSCARGGAGADASLQCF